MLSSPDNLLIVLLCTGFIKILAVLSILRLGLNLTGVGFGIVTVLFAFAVSLMVSNISLKGDLTLTSRTPLNQESFVDFLDKNKDDGVHKRLIEITEGKRLISTPMAQEKKFDLLLSSFLVSELKEAFRVGFLILIPFLVIDLLVINSLMLLNITNIDATLVSLPLKILVFVVIDGWMLLTEKLIGGYF